MTDRTDPTDLAFDAEAYERLNTSRGLLVDHEPHGLPGHDYLVRIPCGHRTEISVRANAAELSRWTNHLAEYAVRYRSTGETCPACAGDIHVDLAGKIWTTSNPALDRVRALHRPIEYRPGDHYARYGPSQFRRPGAPKPPPAPEVVTVCEECQERLDELLLNEHGGYGGWELAEYPCPTIRAVEGDR